MKKGLFLVAFSLSSSIACFAQIFSLSPMYRYDWQQLNPAAINRIYFYSQDIHTIVEASFHKQWLGIQNGPQTIRLSLEHKPLNNGKDRIQSGIKWGVNIMADQTESIDQYGGFGNFSYYFPIHKNKAKFIQIGLNVGWIWQRLSVAPEEFKVFETARIESPDRQWFSTNVGIFYRNQRRFYLGLSMPQAFGIASQQAGIARFKSYQMVNLIFGGFIERDMGIRSSDILIIEPSILIRYLPDLSLAFLNSQTPVSIDVNSRFSVSGSYWLGLGYSTREYLLVEAGITHAFKKGIIVGDIPDEMAINLGWQIPVGKVLNLGNSFEIRIAYAL
jgi:type IX secretion system PorP/SprF family membrane protein